MPVAVVVVCSFREQVRLVVLEVEALVEIVHLLERLVQPIQAVVLAVVEILVVQAQMAAQASSSFPMLAHNNLVAVSSLLLVVTPFTHLQLLALLFQSHL
jgi:hypothetical protein